MSNLYASEPNPEGKVIVETTAGEIEIELWAKEAPKAVRNFIQLAMEGYYDGVIFHRIVKGFIIQTGDPTGTGMGGESIYGEPFQDEIHSRLRFNRRGLIGMANNSKRHTNTSQWFITLDRADELSGRHTVFGRINGPTYYNVQDIGNLEVDADDRPKLPPKIKGIRIVENPFPDIVPRITAAEKKAQVQARLEAQRETAKREKRAKAKKNTALLSFGNEEEVAETAVKAAKRDIARPDLVASAPSKGKAKEVEEQPKAASEERAEPREEKRREEKKAVDLKSIREEHERQRLGMSTTKKEDIERMQEDLRMLKKRQGHDSDSDSEDSETRRRRKKGPSFLEQELAKYSRGRGRAARTGRDRKDRRDNDDDLLKDLNKFSKKVLAMDEEERERAEEGEEDAEPGEGIEIDADVNWMRHALKFEQEVSDETRRAEDEYTVIDPRAKARELAERERKDKVRARQRE